MTKAIVVVFLATTLLAACSSTSTPSSTSGSSNADYLYGRHAGQPMRDAPDSY